MCHFLGTSVFYIATVVDKQCSTTSNKNQCYPDCKHKAIKDDVDRLIDELEGLQAREENLETPSIEEVDDAELLQTGRDTLETDENKHGRRYGIVVHIRVNVT